MFIHLNCHSHYSFTTGADSIDALVQATKEMGNPALAITDINGLHGAVHFYQTAKKIGIHPIFGTEIESFPETPFIGDQRAVLLAKDLQGFGEICRVITDRHLNKNFSLIDAVKNCSDHVIILSPDQNLLQNILKSQGHKNLYAELTTHKGYIDPQLVTFSEKKDLPYVATNRVFFIKKNDWKVHRLLSAIRTNSTINTLPKGAVSSKDAWMKSTKEMKHLFRYLPKAICNTEHIARQCHVDFNIGKICLPKFTVPHGTTHSSYLRNLSYSGARRIYSKWTSAIKDRLENELQMIDSLNLASYFLIVWDIVREANARNIPTVGRGSAANSLVCQCLGITQVDPIKYNLYFERFLNPERTDYPDIDLDFPWNRRDEMIDYVFDKYGHDHVALISAHVHFRSRSLIREVGKALGASSEDIDSFTKTLPHFSDITELEKVCKTVPECKNLPIDEEPFHSIILMSQRIDGFPRYISIHCGGIVISPFPITDRIPLQKTPKGFAVTQYDMYPVEDMGLLKIDLLSQKGLAVIADVIQDVQNRYGKTIDFHQFDPIEDPKTKTLVREGKTMGCFYIESPGMKNLLQQLRVETFEMLTAASSIIRPGVSDSGMMRAFVNRHNGKEETTYLHPKLESVLNETFGVMIYQEDVIKVANAIAGMSLSEADSLRKCMSKKRNWEAMGNYKEKFISGAIKNGVSKTVALEIWRQIESFAGYAFCKAHSASFALVSYQTAWLKVHYPTEFMAAVLSNQGGFYDTCAYIEEARRMGITILPPDINQSHYAFTACINKKGRASGIRVGLMQVKGLSHCSIDSVLEQREIAYFLSFKDFWSRVIISQSEVEELIYCGAFDSLENSRPNMFWQLILLNRTNTISEKNAPSEYLPGFNPRQPQIPQDKIPCLPNYSRQDKLWAELESLDLTVSSHMLELYGVQRSNRNKKINSTLEFNNNIFKNKTWHRSIFPITPGQNISKNSGKLITLMGWLITAKRTWTRKHELMKFMTLEDPTASFEVVLFPKVYKQFGHLLYNRGPYIVRGKVEQNSDCYTLTALWVGRF